jgi:protein-S-isoprenylcysteine O-methyltransferase Ste14
MVVDLVYAMPSWILALVSICVVTAYAIGGLVLVHRFVPAERRRRHNDVAGPVSALVGGVFAVLIAFIAIVVWEQFGQASTLVLRESNAAGDVWRLAYGYPEPLRTQIRDGVRRYLETVIKEEWPQQAKGKTVGRTWRILEDVHRAMLRFEPTTRGQEIIHTEQLRDVNTIMDQRRIRLQAAREGIAPQVWMVVLAGCALMIALMWFFGAESFAAHMGMTVCLSISIGLMIFLIAALDYPFRGDMGIGPEAFEEVLVNLDRLGADERAAQPR